MLIISFNQNNNYTLFRAKNITNIAKNTISSELTNKSVNLDMQIKDFLQNLINKGTPISGSKIAQQLNTTVLTVKGRLFRDSKLKALWEQTPRKIIHYEPQSSIDKTEEIKKLWKVFWKKNVS